MTNVERLLVPGSGVVESFSSPSTRSSSWPPSTHFLCWVSRRPRKGVHLVKTMRGFTYSIRRHMKQAGFRLTNEVASVYQDLEWQRSGISSHGGSGSGAASSDRLSSTVSSGPLALQDSLVGFEEPMSEVLQLVLLPEDFDTAIKELREGDADRQERKKTSFQQRKKVKATEAQNSRRLRFVNGDIVEEVPFPPSAQAVEQKLRVVSIVGYRGIGKTALARAVYDLASTLDSSDHSAFESSAWVQASDCSNGRDLLDKIWKQVTRRANNNLADFYMLNEVLRNKRFLIVIDDLREGRVWYNIQSAFPDSHTGSRVIVTTSIGSVAAACSPERYIYRMRGLGYSDAEKLFWRRVVSRTDRTPSLEYALDDTLRKSGGLPLALISAANNLCREGQNLLPGAPGAFEQMDIVLSECYDSLPDNGHRMCFLSLSTFPQGQLIKRKKLIRRWVAEGLAVGDGVLSAEQVASDRFKELIDRSMIEPVQSGNSSKVKACLVFGVIKDFIVNKSVSKGFITLIRNDELLQTNKKVCDPVHRLSVVGGTRHNERVAKEVELHRVRYLTICNAVPFDFQDCWLLRVLELEACQGVDDKVLRNIWKLVFLKYLSLRRSDVYKISKKIKSLECLETLDIRETRVETLPIEVFMLPRLEHLFGQFELPRQLKDRVTRSKLQAFFSGKSRIQTLSGFVMVESNGFEHIMLNMRLLRKVKIWCNHSITSYQEHLLASSLQKRLAGSNALESVAIDFGNEPINFVNNIGAPYALTSSMKLRGILNALPGFLSSHDTTLSELQLSSTGLTLETLSLLQSLRRLLYLKLVDDGDGFCGDCFFVQSGGFPSLLRMCFEAQKPPQMQIQEGGMSSLTSLHLICPEFTGWNSEESNTVTYSEKSFEGAHSGQKLKRVDPKIQSEHEIQEIEEIILDKSSMDIDLGKSFKEIGSERTKKIIDLKRHFKGIEHLKRLNELVLHRSVGQEVMDAWKDEARSHINRPRVIVG